MEVETITGDRIIELDSLPKNSIDATKQITAGCISSSDFAISGNGGLPENPTQYLRNTTTWQDLRLPKFNNFNSQTTKKISLISQSPTIQEAATWLVNSQGNIELVTNHKKSDRFISNSLKCDPNLVN